MEKTRLKNSLWIGIVVMELSSIVTLETNTQTMNLPIQSG
jgi:hypothetical protein